MPLLLDETALSGDLQDLHALDFRPLETHKAGTSFHSGPFNEREAGALGALVFLGWLAWYGFSAAKEQWMRMPQGARSVTVFALTFVIILWLKRGIGFVKFLFKPFFLEFIPVQRRIAVEVCETLDQIRR